MVFQHSTNFASRRPNAPRSQGYTRGLGASDNLRSMSYEGGRAALSPPNRETEPITPISLPYVRGAWAHFTEAELRRMGETPGSKPTEDEPSFCTWTDLCQYLGLHSSILTAFNPDQAGDVDRVLDHSVVLYIPTPGEVLFWQGAQTMGLAVEAVGVRDCPEDLVRQEPGLISAFQNLERNGVLALVAAARHRAAGKTGRAYGFEAQRFYSRNRRLKGGRGRARIDGSRERAIAWGRGNKCNVFVGDTLDQAGMDSPVSSNGHYATAGRIFTRYSTREGEGSRARHLFQEIPRSELRPGDIFVKNGDPRADLSHTEVVTGTPDPQSFFALGSHFEGGYERHYFTDEAAYQEKLAELAEKERRPEPPGETELAEKYRVQRINLDEYHFLRHRALSQP